MTDRPQESPKMGEDHAVLYVERLRELNIGPSGQESQNLNAHCCRGVSSIAIDNIYAKCHPQGLIMIWEQTYVTVQMDVYSSK